MQKNQINRNAERKPKTFFNAFKFNKKKFHLNMKGLKKMTKFKVVKNVKGKNQSKSRFIDDILVTLESSVKKGDLAKTKMHIIEYNDALIMFVKKGTKKAKKYYPIDIDEYIKDANNLPEKNRKLPNPQAYILSPNKVKQYLDFHFNTLDSTQFKEFLQGHTREEIRSIHEKQGHDEKTIKKAIETYDNEKKMYEKYYSVEAQKLSKNIKKYEEIIEKYPQLENKEDMKKLESNKQILKNLEEVTEYKMGLDLEDNFGLGLADEIMLEHKDFKDLNSIQKNEKLESNVSDNKKDKHKNNEEKVIEQEEYKIGLDLEEKMGMGLEDEIRLKNNDLMSSVKGIKSKIVYVNKKEKNDVLQKERPHIPKRTSSLNNKNNKDKKNEYPKRSKSLDNPTSRTLKNNINL